MKGNTDMIYFRLSTGDSNQIQIENSSIKGILCEWKAISLSFNFDQNAKSFCKKAEAKLKALVKVFPCTVLTKKKLLMNSFLLQSSIIAG